MPRPGPPHTRANVDRECVEDLDKVSVIYGVIPRNFKVRDVLPGEMIRA